jgi:hypothetical protein
VEIGYVGRRGLHQQRERNINQLQPGPVQANPGVNVDYLRPYKGYGVIRLTNNEGSSFYNGLQVGVTRRFSKGLSYGFSYTWSKLLDDGSTHRSIIPNAYDDSWMWGAANYDRRHVAVVNAIYELPFLRGNKSLVGKLAGGWQVSLVAQFQTGTPFWVGTNDDNAGVGTGSGNSGEGIPSTPWNMVGDPRISDPKFSQGAADQNFYFTPGAFAKPAAGTFSNGRYRNRLYHPGFQNWTAALFKTFSFTERHRLTFRSEFYNFPNHPNWNTVDSNPESSTFGKVTAKTFERTMQLSLRYSF